MNSEERFRKSLADMLASKDFTFDEANWDKARQMIDVSKKPRKVAPFMVTAALLIVSLSTAIYFLPNSPSSPVKKTSVVTANELKPVPATTALADSQPITSTPKPNLNTEPAPLQQRAAAMPTNTLPANQPETISASDHLTNDPAPEKIHPVTLEKIVTSAPKISVEIKCIKTPPEKNPVSLGAADVPPRANPLAIGSDDTKTPTSKTPLPESTTTTPLAVNTMPGGNPETKVPAKTKPEGENIASDVTPQANPPKTEPPESLPAKEIPAPSPNYSLANDAPSPLLPPATKDSANALPAPADNDNGELGKPREDLVIFSFEAGPNYAYGWKNPGSHDASGFNPVVGINYFTNFKSKMSLSIGLHYTSVSNLSFSSYTSKVVHLGLGEESHVSVFTPVKVHYAIVPLRLNYSLNTKNTFGIGCNIAYLLNIQSTLYTYTEKLNKKYDEKTTTTSGYIKGFKQYDTQLSLFYKRAIYKNLAANLELYYGLRDTKDNTFFNSNVFERNTGLKLTLVYNFLKK